MNDNTATPRTSSFSASQVIIPIIVGVIGFAAGFLFDDVTSAFRSGPSEAQQTYQASSSQPRDEGNMRDERNGETTDADSATDDTTPSDDQPQEQPDDQPEDAANNG